MDDINGLNMVLQYFIISLLNVFIHVVKTILVVKSNKLTASLSNCFCYTFSAVVIKYIAEVDLLTAILVQACTNFFGCYIAMWACEKYLKKYNLKDIGE